MRRLPGIVLGLATHALFAFTVWHLFWFLRGAPPVSGPQRFTPAVAAGIDAVLAVGFALPHSVLLAPAVRRRIMAAGVPGPCYGCCFCVATCLALLVTIFCWQPIAVVAWRWPAPCDAAVAAGFGLSWVALLYSLHLTGLGWQTGWTPWWNWVRGLPQPRREFSPRGAYRFLRHPVYLSFLGLIWCVPEVSFDRAVLIAVWTGYIYVGSVLKDRRLEQFIGAPYREYATRVPGYPGMPVGPLARLPRPVG